MQELVRAAFASLVKAVIANANPAPLTEDGNPPKTRNFRGSIVGSDVHVLSEDNSVHLSGALPNLFEDGTQARYFLTIAGGDFSGFDYGTEMRFSGRVNGGIVTLYDFATQRNYTYR